MTQYLGVCMVVIVSALCIGILSTIVTENILKQIEAHRIRVSDRRWAEFGKYLIKFRDTFKTEIDKMLEETKMNRTKDFMKMVDEKTEELKEKGIDIDNI